MTDLAALELADFTSTVGDRVVVEVGGGSIEVVVAAAESLGSDDPSHRAFAVLFHGPVEPLLAQGTYTFRHTALGDPAIFVVPIAQTAGHTVYEAVFSRLEAPEATD